MHSPHVSGAEVISLICFSIFSPSSLCVRFHQREDLNLLHVCFHGHSELCSPVQATCTGTSDRGCGKRRGITKPLIPPASLKQAEAAFCRAAQEQDQSQALFHSAPACHRSPARQRAPGAGARTRRLISSCLSGADLAVAFIMVDV